MSTIDDSVFHSTPLKSRGIFDETHDKFMIRAVRNEACSKRLLTQEALEGPCPTYHKQCGKVSSSAKSLKRHVRTIHNEA